MPGPWELGGSWRGGTEAREKTIRGLDVGGTSACAAGTSGGAPGSPTASGLPCVPGRTRASYRKIRVSETRRVDPGRVPPDRISNPETNTNLHRLRRHGPRRVARPEGPRATIRVGAPRREPRPGAPVLRFVNRVVPDRVILHVGSQVLDQGPPFRVPVLVTGDVPPSRGRRLPVAVVVDAPFGHTRYLVRARVPPRPYHPRTDLPFSDPPPRSAASLPFTPRSTLCLRLFFPPVSLFVEVTHPQAGISSESTGPFSFSFPQPTFLIPYFAPLNIATPSSPPNTPSPTRCFWGFSFSSPPDPPSYPPVYLFRYDRKPRPPRRSPAPEPTQVLPPGSTGPCCFPPSHGSPSPFLAPSSPATRGVVVTRGRLRAVVVLWLFDRVVEVQHPRSRRTARRRGSRRFLPPPASLPAPPAPPPARPRHAGGRCGRQPRTPAPSGSPRRSGRPRIVPVRRLAQRVVAPLLALVRLRPLLRSFVTDRGRRAPWVRLLRGARAHDVEYRRVRAVAVVAVPVPVAPVAPVAVRARPLALGAPHLVAGALRVRREVPVRCRVVVARVRLLLVRRRVLHRPGRPASRGASHVCVVVARALVHRAVQPPVVRPVLVVLPPPARRRSVRRAPDAVVAVAVVQPVPRVAVPLLPVAPASRAAAVPAAQPLGPAARTPAERAVRVQLPGRSRVQSAVPTTYLLSSRLTPTDPGPPLVGCHGRVL